MALLTLILSMMKKTPINNKTKSTFLDGSVDIDMVNDEKDTY